MSEATGKRCAKCFEIVGYRKEGKCCGTCGQPIHLECVGLTASVDKSRCCAECGVITHCDLCELEKTEIVPAYLQLRITSPGIGSVSARCVNLQCNCCQPCLRKGAKVRWAGAYSLAIMFGTPLVLFGICTPIMIVLFGENGLLPEFIFGIPRKWYLGDVFPFVALVLTCLGIIFAIPLSGVLARARMNAAYKPALDRRLREIAGVSRWGAFANVSVTQEISGSESVTPLN